MLKGFQIEDLPDVFVLVDEFSEKAEGFIMRFGDKVEQCLVGLVFGDGGNKIIFDCSGIWYFKFLGYFDYDLNLFYVCSRS